MADWERRKFRAWLVERVLETRLARVCCVAVFEGREEAVAEQAGLHPTLVHDVGVLYAERVVAAGRPVPTGPKKSSRVYPQLGLKLPQVAADAWRERADRMHVSATAMLRTMIHEYLLGQEEPLHRDKRWVVDGQVVSGSEARLNPAITHGAKAALSLRAERLGFAVVELVGALMVDVLSGRRRVGAPIAVSTMYADRTRYRC